MMSVDKKIIRAYKYKSDQQGIISRYLRENGAWDSHLRNCRNYILDAFDRSGESTVTVLGSGWLLDIPLEELSKKAVHIYLVDILHPVQIVHKVRNLKNVELVEDDLTGGLAQLCLDTKSLEGMVGGGEGLPIYTPAFEAGLMVSANLLTQLDGLLVETLVKRSGYEKDDLLGLRGLIHQKHIDMLSQRPSVLITEQEEQVYNSDSKPVTRPLVYCKLPHGNRVRKWKWRFDSKGTYYRNSKVVFDVVALNMNF